MSTEGQPEGSILHGHSRTQADKAATSVNTESLQEEGSGETGEVGSLQQFNVHPRRDTHHFRSLRVAHGKSKVLPTQKGPGSVILL